MTQIILWVASTMPYCRHGMTTWNARDIQFSTPICSLAQIDHILPALAINTIPNKPSLANIGVQWLA